MAGSYRDARWQIRKSQIMLRDGGCVLCRTEEPGVTLHVHHQAYDPFVDIWDYDDDILVTLCEDCHLQIQRRMTRVHMAVAKLGVHWLNSERADKLINWLEGVERENSQKVAE